MFYLRQRASSTAALPKRKQTNKQTRSYFAIPPISLAPPEINFLKPCCQRDQGFKITDQNKAGSRYSLTKSSCDLAMLHFLSSCFAFKLSICYGLQNSLSWKVISVVTHSINGEIAHNGGVEFPSQVNPAIWCTQWFSNVPILPNTAPPECGGICTVCFIFFQAGDPQHFLKIGPFSFC